MQDIWSCFLLGAVGSYNEGWVGIAAITLCRFQMNAGRFLAQRSMCREILVGKLHMSGSMVKILPAIAGDAGLISGSGRSPVERSGSSILA